MTTTMCIVFFVKIAEQVHCFEGLVGSHGQPINYIHGWISCQSSGTTTPIIAIDKRGKHFVEKFEAKEFGIWNHLSIEYVHVFICLSMYLSYPILSYPILSYPILSYLSILIYMCTCPVMQIKGLLRVASCSLQVWDLSVSATGLWLAGAMLVSWPRLLDGMQALKAFVVSLKSNIGGRFTWCLWGVTWNLLYKLCWKGNCCWWK